VHATPKNLLGNREDMMPKPAPEGDGKEKYQSMASGWENTLPVKTTSFFIQGSGGLRQKKPVAAKAGSVGKKPRFVLKLSEDHS